MINFAADFIKKQYYGRIFSGGYAEKDDADKNIHENDIESVKAA